MFSDARVCFRSHDVTASFASFCDEPDALVTVSSDREKQSTPLHVAAPSSSGTELLSDMPSITYHPNPLIVSANCLFLLFNPFTVICSYPVNKKILCHFYLCDIFGFS